MTKKSYLLWDVGMSKIGETTPFEQNVVLPASILSNLGEWNGIISPSRNIWEKLQEQPAVISLQYMMPKKGNATIFFSSAWNHCSWWCRTYPQSPKIGQQFQKNSLVITQRGILPRQVAGRSKTCISSVGRDAWKGTSSRRDKLFIVGRIFPMFLHLQ